MPPRHKSDRERLADRARILDAARDLFLSRGTEAVTMREIGRRVQCSATALYLHFRDKEDLIRSLCDNDFRAMAEDQRTVMREPDPVLRLTRLARGYVRFAVECPNHYRLMFMTERPPCDPEQSAIEYGNPEQDAYAQLKAAVQAVFDARLFRHDLTDPELIAQTLWAGMHGVCALHITLNRDAWVQWRPFEGRVALMMETLMRGLLADLPGAGAPPIPTARTEGASP